MVRHAARVAGLAAVLLLSGCKLTPDYARPDLGLPEEWAQPTDGGESIANLPWWEVFEDPVLVDLVHAALEENQDLLLALDRIEESRYRVTFTRADQFPFLDVFGGASRGRPSQSIFPGTGTSNQFALDAMVTFELDLWREFWRATEAARYQLLASEAAYRNVTISVVANVANTYLLLRDLDARLAISQETVESRKDSLGIIEARFDRGTVPAIDVRQAQIQLSIAEAAVAQFERQVVQTENALRVLLGRYPGPVPRGETLAGQRVAFPEVPPGLTSDLLERRPDIVEAEQLLASEVAGYGVAQAQRLPRISLTASLGAIADELSDLNGNEIKAWNIAAGALQPIFRAGQLRAQAKAQRARAEQAIHSYVSTVQRAFREVEDSLVAVKTLREESEAQQRRVRAARSAKELSKARYDGGVVDFLEVLDSERNFFDAALAESAVRREALSAVVNLYKALGGGWTPPDTPDGQLPEPDPYWDWPVDIWW